MRLPRHFRQHVGDNVRALIIAIALNILVTAWQSERGPLLLVGLVLLVIGVVMQSVIRIDIETAIDCALSLPARSTRADLHEVMCGRPILFDD